MRNRELAMVVAATLLAGCGPVSTTNDGAAIVNGAATEASAKVTDDRPRPGTYSIKLVDEFIGTEDPERIVTESTRAFTADQFASENWIASTLEGNQCRDRRLTIKDGDISGGMRCDMAEFEVLDQPVDLHGSYTRNGWDVTLDMTGGGFTQRRSVTLRRIGD